MLVFVDCFSANAGFGQRVPLKVQILGTVGFRDAGISDQHMSYTFVCDAVPPAGSGVYLHLISYRNQDIANTFDFRKRPLHDY